MADNFNEDKEFQDYLNNNDNSEDQLLTIVKTIYLKSNTIYEFYSKTVDTYLKLNEKDPLKTEFEIYLKDLMKQSLYTIAQFDYALIEEDDEDGDEGDLDERY